MKRTLQLLSLCLIACISYNAHSQTTIRFFNKVLFFDGYAGLVTDSTYNAVSPSSLPAGLIRHRNDLYATKISDAQLASIGTSLTMNVTIKASCDNYDRIGNVNLALVPKGATAYNPDSVKRIEIGRYITPFMNKNVMPDTVPYTYNINNVAHLLKETGITSIYDIWIELEVFGVPYAANTQVAGCSGRNDVFFGTVDFVTNTPTPAENTNVLLPLSFKKILNDYEPAATDQVGTTKRTINFNLSNPLTDAIFVLITSNHGANSGGEEYNRRNHFIYFDGSEVLTYKPGRTSCEPFRKYNTQGNGIYGSSPKSDATWQSFSNWCPGDVITTRIINLGPLPAGSHSFRIEVPDAVFANNEGYFPVSLYLQGKTSGTILDIEDAAKGNVHATIFPNPSNDIFNIDTEEKIEQVTVLNLLGQKVFSGNGKQINIANLPSGMYWAKINFSNDKSITRKLIKK
jgi:hypothetical protein